MIAVADLPGIVVDDAQAKKVGEWKRLDHPSRPTSAHGYVHDGTTGKGEKTLTFQPDLPEAGKYEVRLAYSPGTNRATNVPVTVFSADGEKDDPRRPEGSRRRSTAGSSRSGSTAFEKNGQGFVLISNEGTNGLRRRRRGAVPAGGRRAAGDGAATLPRRSRPSRSTPCELKRLEAELKKLTESGPKRELAMSVVEEQQEIGDTQVHVRGSVHNLGEPSRAGSCRWRSAAAGPRDAADAERPAQAGRLARRPGQPADGPRRSSTGPGTGCSGQGIVRTADNFGTTGEPPSHPDCSTTWPSGSSRSGWSVKKLVRRDRPVAHVPALDGGGREGAGGRPGEPPVRADEPPPARRRVHPRHDPVGQRPARPGRGRPDVPGRLVVRLRLQAGRHPPERLPARSSATRCRSCSRCSTSPTRAWSPAGATSAPSPRRRCS